MTKTRLTFLMLGAILVVGCGGSESSVSGAAGADGSGGATSVGGAAGSAGQAGGPTGGAGAPTFLDEFSVEIGPISVQPGVERTQCVVKRLGNPTPINVGRVSNVISSSSHHMIVYKSSDTTERPQPFSCTPFLDTLNPANGAPLLISQRKDDELVLPRGVAFQLDADQMIRLELHYINTQPDPLDVVASSTFSTIPDEQFEQAADFMFLGTPDISIPPRSEWSVTSHLALPPELEGVEYFAITGHTHQLGTSVSIATATDAGDPGTAVYDVPGWLWDEPDTVIHDPPFRVPSGGGFNFTCNYNNTTNRNVQFGESVDAEMCFFWAYYYPSQGSKLCVHTDMFLGGIDACCPGSPICDLIAF